jgi:hypothetical protein
LGHTKEHCYSFTKPGKLKDQTVSIRQDGRNIVVSVKDVNNNLEALEVIHGHLSKRIEAERKALEKSHGRAQERRSQRSQNGPTSQSQAVSRDLPGPWSQVFKEEMLDDPPNLS